MDNEEKNNTLNKIEAFLCEAIEHLKSIRTDPVGRGRPRILPSMCLWGGVVVCVLRGWNSQLAVWRLLNKGGLWDYPRFPISDQAVYKRLEKEGDGPLKQLFEQISKMLKDRLEPYSQKIADFATEVVAIDQTTLDKVSRHLPLLREISNGDKRLLPGQLAGIFNVRMQQWQHVEYIENPNQNEKVVARSLLEHIQRGGLILMDLGFFSFEWFDQLTNDGYFWISRMRQKTSYDIHHLYYREGDTFDGVIWLGKYRADKTRHAVRLVSFTVGEKHYQYITNVLSPKTLSIQDIAVLYARRWDIELAFKLVKRELGLHLFWSAKQSVILQQVWAVLLISQILHALQLEIAAKAGVDPFDVSLALLIEYLPRWNDIDFIEYVVKDGQNTGFIRPSRRIRIHTPPVDIQWYVPLPPDFPLSRNPRYAHRL